MRTIIPAAGFGTTMDLEPHQSKELMRGPDGKLLIEYALERATNPLVVTRKSKTSLVEWLKENNVPHMLISPAKDWPDTVLKSKKYWEDENVILLPDARFRPEGMVDTMESMLKSEYKLVAAVHMVSDLADWGGLVTKFIEGKATEVLWEKPQHFRHEGGLAWGLLGFRKEIGEDLFRACRGRKPFTLPADSAKLYLDTFEDVTREL
jgi:UTP-glucose-1-phosphate uridylyltransferase